MLKIRSINSLDALKMSMQCEMDMKKFYELAAVLMKNDDADAILKGIMDKKEKHRQNLMKIYGKVSGKKILYLNLGKKHKLNTLEECGDDPNEAVRIAKKNEGELKKFYLTISRRLMEAELRQIFRDLALEEEQLLALLESSFVEPLTLDQEPSETDADEMGELASTEETRSKLW